MRDQRDRRHLAPGAATRRAVGAVCLLLCAGAVPAAPATTASPPIYSCVDGNGKRLTSDRPIPECSAREQRVLNADGSVKRVLPPTMTTEERADAEARERDAVLERAARLDAIRRDRNLLARFPNEAAHRKARAAALDDVRKSMRVSEARLSLLAIDRKPLMDESEFYIGKAMPPQLKQALDANDASTEAQRTLVLNQQAEIVRIDSLYDAELERLRKLWGGVQPGSLGALPRAASAPSASASVARVR